MLLIGPSYYDCGSNGGGGDSDSVLLSSALILASTVSHTCSYGSMLVLMPVDEG